MYVCIYSCTGSSLLLGLSPVAEAWGYSRCGVQASRCGGFSCGAQAPVRAGFSSCGTQARYCGSWALEHKVDSCDVQAWFLGCRLSCLKACGILVPGPEIEPVSSALEDGFLTTVPPVKSLIHFIQVASLANI